MTCSRRVVQSVARKTAGKPRARRLGYAAVHSEAGLGFASVGYLGEHGTTVEAVVYRFKSPMMNSLSVVTGIIVAVNTSPLWEACHICAVRPPQGASKDVGGAHVRESPKIT
jgi:hypothetical protein